MRKVAVVYWSGTGNTEAMAKKVLEGARMQGAEAALFTAEQFRAEMLADYEAVAFGCPSMGAEELEESEFAPMFDACRPLLQGQKIALFGSYGWGDGEWMRSWEGDCLSLGAVLLCQAVICNEAPDEEAEQACLELGKALA
ncbi:MAG: flavodoxin [Bacillota bacterium]|nr:flavodoxin [Bacillota bacterium]